MKGEVSRFELNTLYRIEYFYITVGYNVAELFIQVLLFPNFSNFFYAISLAMKIITYF